MKLPNRLIDEFFEVHKEMDRVFDSFMAPTRGFADSLTADSTLWKPPMDIYETPECLVVKVELAGIKPGEDIKVQIEGNNLILRGNRKDRTKSQKLSYHLAGLHYGPFETRIMLPNAQYATPQASYENGFLEIKIIKKQLEDPEVIVVAIDDKTGGDGS